MTVLSSSFKDPSGFVFKQDNQIFRQVNTSYQENYDFLFKSGIYNELTKGNLLVSHEEITSSKTPPGAYKILKPRPIPFISYPYEWSFSQLKDAALLTLHIQKTALKFGMSLKDATNFNVQFLLGRPILIDTLSFEKYQVGTPWIAYKQFCEQFLAPLALAAEKDISLIKLLQIFPGGIPLEITSKLLPLKSKLKPGLLIHLLLHAKSQKKYAASALPQKTSPFSLTSMLGLLDSLESVVNSLSWPISQTVWSTYETNLPKQKIVADYLKFVHPKTLWDLGANTGTFSRLAASQGIFTVSVDNDPAVVEINYQQVKKGQEKNILPLWIDLVNPTPGLGWANVERDSLLSRPHPDCLLVLALIHHLAISNNLPLPILASFFARLAPSLIIEFVPKEDPQTKRLLQSREDIFPNYTIQNFEKEFSRFFQILKKSSISKSDRTIYLMKLKNTR